MEAKPHIRIGNMVMPNTYQTMNTNTQIEKIDKVLSKISGKELKAFAHLYACTHDDFATALVEKYWKPERGNYKEMGRLCLMTSSVWLY